MTAAPDWWAAAEKEIDSALAGFTTGLKRKLEECGNKPSILLKKKNPFLLRIRGAETAHDLVKRMLEALLSSSEETRFGNSFEKCAEVVCKYGRDGKKSGIEGIDLEYAEHEEQRTLIQVKSSVNWGNSSQKKQLSENFKTACRILKQGGSVKNVRCVEGICYGKNERVQLGDRERIVGESFWEEISGWRGLYSALMEKAGLHAGNGLQEAKDDAILKIVAFMRERSLLVEEDKVDWDELLIFLSQS